MTACCQPGVLIACRDRQKHLNAVWGDPNIPHALQRSKQLPASWQAQVPDRPDFDIMPSLYQPVEEQPFNERIDRLTNLMLHHLLAQSTGLPAFAYELSLNASEEHCESFLEFADRLVTAALRRVYRPSMLMTSLQALGEQPVAADIAAVKARLARYAGEEQLVRRTPLLKQIRCDCVSATTVKPSHSLRSHCNLHDDVPLSKLCSASVCYSSFLLDLLCLCAHGAWFKLSQSNATSL